MKDFIAFLKRREILDVMRDTFLIVAISCTGGVALAPFLQTSGMIYAPHDVWFDLTLILIPSIIIPIVFGVIMLTISTIRR